MKKLRVASVPEVSAVSVSRVRGSASVLVDFSGTTKVHVTLVPPRPPSQGAVHDKAVVEVDMQIAPFCYKYEIDEDIRDSRVAEVSALVQEAVTACVDLSAYPKTILTFRVVVLETSEFDVASLVPAVLLGSTLALEKAEIAGLGRALALSVADSGVIGFDVRSGKIILLHSSTLPDVASAMATVKEFEKDLITRNLLL